jgi:hypothetical protein
MYNVKFGADSTDNLAVMGKRTVSSREVYLKYGSTVKKLNYFIDWSTKADDIGYYPYF